MGRADQRIIPGHYRVYPRTLCFITCGDDVLLLRGAPAKPIWPDRYNGVGGHVRPDEDIFAAARREIVEETGLRVQDLRLRGVVNIPAGGSQDGILLFVFTGTSDTRDVRASEEGIPEWVPASAINQVDMVEDLPILLPRVLLMGPEDPPFFAHYAAGEDDELVVTIASGLE